MEAGEAPSASTRRVSHPVRAVAGRDTGLLQLRPGGARAAARRGWLSTRHDGVRLSVPFDVWEGRDLGFFELQAASLGATSASRSRSIPWRARPTWRWRQSGAAEGMTSRESGFTSGDPAGTLRAVSYTEATWNIPGQRSEADELIDAAASTVDIDEYTRLQRGR